MNEQKFESLEQMADATAATLVRAAAGFAFKLFSDKKFRRLAGFDSLSQGEQDRIFNELVLGALIQTMLLLEAPDLRVPPEVRNHLATVGKRLPAAHVDYLRETGIEPEHLQIWETLIAMRYDEYARDRHDVRAAAMQIEGAEAPLAREALTKIQLFLPVQTVAIGCHVHICRGQTEGHDALFKQTLKALGDFYVELRVGFEGGSITPMMRARVAVMRLFRSMRSK